MIAFPIITVMVLGICLWLASERTPFSMKDCPNPRSLHAVETPHTGGMGILLGIGMGWAWYAIQYGWPYTLSWLPFSALLVATVSFLDDIKPLSALCRLAVHGIAAFILVSGGLTLPGMVGAVVSWFAIIWMMNLFNFMDGMDGLAGGMAVFGFGTLGLTAWLSGHVEYAQLVWLIAAAAVGFLIPNFSPARIFMGDTGSITLGLFAAVFSLWGIRDDIFPVWFPMLVFSPFILDATITLIRRAIRREKVWQAHREHFYQKMVLAGWRIRNVLVVEYILMFSVGLTGVITLNTPHIFAGDCFVGVGGNLLFANIGNRNKNKSKSGSYS